MERKFLRPTYCSQPSVNNCVMCSLSNYGMDCYNRPHPAGMEDDAVMVDASEAARAALVGANYHRLTAIDALSATFKIDRDLAAALIDEQMDTAARERGGRTSED